MRKKLALSLLSAASILSLAACASGEGAEAGDTTGESSGDDTILVYSNSLADGRQEWIDKQAQEAGFDVEYVEAGGGEIFNRILAEANSPQADVVFGMDEAMFFQLQNEDLLVQFEPEWIDEIPEEANIGDGYFHPLVEQRIFMIYNPEHVSEEEVPENWQDLGNTPEYAQKYRIATELGGGTNQKTILSILLQYVDEDGELGIAQEGWDEVEKYLANGYMTPESEDHWQNFADGSVPISYHFSGGIPGVEEEYGLAIEPINPEQGVVTMREQIGVMNKGKDHDYSTAQEFVGWFGSAEVQAGFVEEFGGQPVNEVAFDSAPERLQELAEATEPMEIDWDFVQENLNAWIEKVELELMP